MKPYEKARVRRILIAVWLVPFVGLVALMMIPVGGGASSKSSRRICESNLKQLSIALSLYADIYQGRCPVDAAHPTLLGCMKLLSNATDSAKILYCPADARSRDKAEMDFGKLTVQNISYSYVPNLIWSDLKPDSIVALDCIYTTAAGSKWPANGNHRSQGGCILFGDGRVTFQSALPSALKDKDGKEVVLSP